MVPHGPSPIWPTLEIYEDVGALEEVLDNINTATWGAIGSGLGN